MKNQYLAILLLGILSESICSLPAAITAITPSAGVYHHGDVMRIGWKTNVPGQYTVSVSMNGADFFRIPDSATAVVAASGRGSLQWKIPCAVRNDRLCNGSTSCSHLRIRVSAGPSASAVSVDNGLTIQPRPLSAKPVRMVMNFSLFSADIVLVPGTERIDTSNAAMREKLSFLDYLAKLGYTHIISFFINGFSSELDAANHWLFSAGDYSRGFTATRFRVWRREIEKRGMKMVPELEVLSHVSSYISRDKSISEFYDPSTARSTWDAYCGKKHHDWLIKCDPAWDHVAYVGKYPDLKNVSMDEAFESCLKIINANWTWCDTPAPACVCPDFINIGHDEIGCANDCYIGEGRSAANLSDTVTRSELLAREIAYRCREIRDLLAPGVRAILFGDHLVPTEWGEPNGLTGDRTTGNGGVLRILRDNADIQMRIIADPLRKIIVAPWSYEYVDGFNTWASGMHFSKAADLRYLDAVGCDYLISPGEGGANRRKDQAAAYHSENYRGDGFSPAFGTVRPRVGFEWYRAAQQSPAHYLGQAILTYDYLDLCDPDPDPGYCAGYTFPVYAYLARYPYLAATFDGETQAPYFKDVFSGVRFCNSRKQLSWTYGRDYTTGLSLRTIGSVNAGSPEFAMWDSAFAAYALTCSGGGIAEKATTDNFAFAFVPREASFEIAARLAALSRPGAMAGIMVRKDVSEGAAFVLVYYDAAARAIRVLTRSTAGSPSTPVGSAMANASLPAVFKVVRTGTTASAYASSNGGKSFRKLAGVAFGSGKVLVGFANAPGAQNDVAATFSDISIKP